MVTILNTLAFVNEGHIGRPLKSGILTSKYLHTFPVKGMYIFFLISTHFFSLGDGLTYSRSMTSFDIFPAHFPLRYLHIGYLESTKSIRSKYTNKQPTPLASKHNLSKSRDAYWINAVAKDSTPAITLSSSTLLCSMPVMIDKLILRICNNYKFLLQSSANTPTKISIQTN